MISNVEGLLIFASVVSFVLGITAELIGFHVISCWIIVAMLFFVLLLVLPKLFRRFKHKNKKWVNFLNLMAIILFSFCVIYLMASLIYYAIWGVKFWDMYEVVLYPTVLVYLLLEVYLNFLISEKYKYHDE